MSPADTQRMWNVSAYTGPYSHPPFRLISYYLYGISSSLTYVYSPVMQSGTSERRFDFHMRNHATASLED